MGNRKQAENTKGRKVKLVFFEEERLQRTKEPEGLCTHKYADTVK